MGFFNLLPGKFHLFLATFGLFLHFIALTISGHSTVVVVQNPPLPPSVLATSTPTAPKVAVKVATSTPKTVPTVQVHSTVPLQPASAVKVVAQATSTPAEPVVETLDNTSVQASGQAIESLNTIARGALVNILCITQTGGLYEPISGSGVFVDNRGTILTNAHVAQYLLLKDFPFANNISCTVRTGSPAAPTYTAQVMYLPPEWVETNASELTSQKPLGTGENDYAFLHVTGTVTPSIALPSSFPVLPMTSASPDIGAPVILAAYPAGLLDGQTIQENLYSSSAVSTVQNLYSFDGKQQVDLISLAGSVVSQTGSSGGALVGVGSGKLLGIIATETAGTTTADRQLNAVTIGFIDRSLTKAGFGGLSGFLSLDPAAQAANFQANTAPQEIAELTAALNKTQN